MGAKQSQDSTTSPVAATTRREEGPVLFPSLFSPLVSNPPPSSSHGAAYPPGESANQGGRDLEVPPALPIRPFFAGQVPDEGESLTTGFSERGWDRHGHHHEATPPHGSHEDRPRHHHRSHHHHHHQNGSGHGRRAHRYLVEDRSNSEPVGMELDFSLAALNQRLRALQLRRETEESGSGSSSGGSRHRSHRSHSRNQYLSPGSFFFVRPVERKSVCPVCRKEVPSGELDAHIVMCMTKPRVEFNEDKLQQDAGECTICLEDMFTGDSIARLPCLCVYHLKCLRLWYKKSQTCPEHPEFVS